MSSRTNQGRGDQGGGSPTKSPVRPSPTEQEVNFRLAFEEALDDPAIANNWLRLSNPQTRTSLMAWPLLWLRFAASRLRDNTIAELRREIKRLKDDHDALEQYGRRNKLRISGIPEKDKEDTTQAVMAITNDIMELDPPLQPGNIEVSHRLPKPRNSKPEEPRQVIVRFRPKAIRYSVISNRNNLKEFNDKNDCKIYINEDLTSTRAKLFSTVRTLQKKRHFDQVWTYNGNVKVKLHDGHIKPIANLDDVKKTCLPNVDLTQMI